MLSDKEIADLTGLAWEDQAKAGVQSMARVEGMYYRTLVEEGLPPEYAIALVRDWQITALHNNQAKPK